MRVALGLIAAVLLSLGLSTCTAARMGKNLNTNVLEQKKEFRVILGRIQNEPSQAISWDGAYKRMIADNISLRQSKLQVEDSKKQKTRQWLSLVPRLSSYLNIGTSVNQLSNLSSKDLNASLLANFNIPNPFEFYAGLYGVALQQQNAIWSHELDKRRAYTQLYSAFVESESIDEAEATYQRRLKSLIDGQSDDVDKLVKSITTDLQNLEHRKLYHRLSINQLLNTPGSNWKLTGSLPKISYAGRYRSLVIGENFGKLALNLQAIQIESAMLSLEQVKFQRWPTFNFGLSNPPLYSSNTTNSFSSDNLQLFSGVYKSFDLTDIGGREDIQNAKTRLKFTREQLRLRAETEGSRLLQLIQSYDTLTTDNHYLTKKAESLSRPGSQEPEVVLKDLERRSDLELNLIENRRQIQQLDLQFLIWDETFWN
jgi:hypothetical protein